MRDQREEVLGAADANGVGGFMVTDRMLGMFARKPKPASEEAKE